MNQDYHPEQSVITPQKPNPFKEEEVQQEIQQENDQQKSPMSVKETKTEQIKEDKQKQNTQQRADQKSFKKWWNQLSKMKRAACISVSFSTIILLIIMSCYIYTVSQGPKFHNAPVQIEAVYETNNQRIVYYYFKMNQPSFIRVGKLVQGYAEAVYYLYTGMEYQAKTVGRITIMHKLSGILLKAFNQKNIELQYDLQTILHNYALVLTSENKRLLQGSESSKTIMNQSPKASNFVEVIDKAITNLFASMMNVQVSTLQNIKETTFLGKTKTNTKQQVYQIQTKPKQTDKTQPSQLQMIKNKGMTEAQQSELVNDIIQKVVQPVLKDLLRQIIEYGPRIAEKVGVIFDDSVDLRVTYQKVTIIDGKMKNLDSKFNEFRNQPAKIITRQNAQAYANKHSSPSDTKTMSQRIFNAINSCTNMDENTKMCTKQEWKSQDTPFPMTKQSKENEKNFQEYTRNKLATKNIRPMSRQLAEAAYSNQINSLCGSKSGSSSSASSNQS